MTTRERILDAAAELFWERGYTATSPQAIQKKAGIGQSSMYHHFGGKADLAAASLDRSGRELRASVDELLGAAPTPFDAVLGYLQVDRAPLKGCRVGRMTQDPDVLADDGIRGPIAETLVWYQSRLGEMLRAAQREGQLRDDFSPSEVASTLVAIVQGAHVLARAEQSSDAFGRVIAGAVQLVNSLRA